MDGDDVNKPPLYKILPEPVKRRINALKKLQLESLNLEADFFNDVHKLECSYHHKFKELYDKREKIVSGTVEPPEEDCNFHLPADDDDSGNFDDALIAKLKEQLSITKLVEEGASGIPEFWLTIFKNVELLNDMIQPYDEPILKYLTDVQVEMIEKPLGFILKFIFAPNPYFTNEMLTKQYDLKCTLDENDPWSFEGPEIQKCKGCRIAWNTKMNVTRKTIRKKQRHKSNGAVRTVVKEVQNDSFFNFFDPPLVSENDEEIDDETQALLTSDFEIGHYIRDKIIPRAVLYYTGEALDDDEFDEESSEGSDSDQNDDDDDEDDEDDELSDNQDFKNKSNNAKNKNKNNSNKNIANIQMQQQECAQQ